MRIDIIVYDGVDELDALGPLEIFRAAQQHGADIEARLVTLTAQALVTGSHGLRFVPDAASTPGADVVVVPGGGWITRSEAGAWGEVRRGDWLPALRAAADAGALMTAVCTGAMMLAHAGLVGGRRATTHRGALAELEATGATVIVERVVDDGDLVTCGGVTSGFDLALWLVERFATAEIAEEVARDIEYTRTRPTLD
jgi:transcriptional regulator GlxA family with amidase domain